MLGNECEVPNARILGELSMGIEYQQLAVTATDWKSVFLKVKSEQANEGIKWIHTYLRTVSSQALLKASICGQPRS